ncbi:MAG TPA: DUF5723 family protein [Bacteroidia bacterium]|nr:DUF5723 family protein [Bacteroidia bacterium]
MRKITFILLVILALPLYMEAQLNFVFPVGTARGGAMTALSSDWESIAVSPSNLGWDENHKISFTLVNFGISAQADQLTIPNIKKIVNNNDTALLEQILSSHGGLNLYANMIWAAFSVKIPKIGGFAFSVSDRAYGNIFISPNVTSTQDFDAAFAAVASTAFTPQNAQKFNSNVNVNGADSLMKLINLLNSFNTTHVSLYEYREINLDYGRHLFTIGDDSSGFRFYGGVGLKYLIGLADIHGEFDNYKVAADYAVDNSGNFSPFGSGAPGHGVGMDIGASMAYKKWKFAVSATDIGSINWTGTHSTLSDSTVAQRIIQNRKDSNNSNNIGSYIQSNSETFETILPAKLRFGAAYKVNKYLTLASDIIMPLNNEVGNLEGTYYSIAGHLRIGKLLTLDAGLASARYYGVVLPAGIAFGNRIQIYFGVNDVLTFLGKTENTDVSAAFGLIRVNL